jgi:PAS domain S-box-containing protein
MDAAGNDQAMTDSELVSNEIRDLRRTLRDLLALSALPAMWAGRPPAEILQGLAETVQSLMRPDLVYLCLQGIPGGSRFEAAYRDGRRLADEQTRRVGQALALHLGAPTGPEPHAGPHPLAAGTLRTVVIPIGHDAAGGVIAVGGQQPDFPTEAEYLLLSVAANQATIWSQEARQIAGLNQREEDLRRSQQELDDFFENAAVALHWVGPDGVIQRANRAELDLLGYAREEYVGHHIREIHTDPEVIDDILQRLSSGETLLDYEARLRARDGSIRHVQINSNVLWDGDDGHFTHARCFTFDITERKRVEAERLAQEWQLRASEERFRALANAVPAIVWTAAPDGTLMYVSDQWFEYCGLTPEQNVRGWPERVLHPDDYDRWVSQWTQALKQGTEYEIEVRNRRHDGQFRWFLTRAVPVRDSAGNVTAWYGTTTDIHERKQLEMRLETQAARLKVLARASRAFAEIVHDYEALLDTVVRQVSELLGDMCLIRLLADNATWHPSAAIHHPDPLAQALIQELVMSTQSADDDLTAEIIRSGRPMFFAESDGQRRSRVPDYFRPYLEKYGLYSAILVPLKTAERVIGVMVVARDKPGRPYTAEDQDLLTDLADRATLAIESATLYENEQRARTEAEGLNAELEQRVAERTSELRALATRLQAIREEERTRVAREIHDELGGELTGLKMEIMRLRKNKTRHDPELLASLDVMKDLVDQTIQTVRRIATDLRPAILDDFGLLATIEWQLQEFQSRSGISTELVSQVEELDLDRERATAVFRIFQEALTNVARHAQATRVEACLERQADCLVLQVRDNGRGISPQQLAGTKSLGLVGMRERVRLLSGELIIQAVPGSGTCVLIKVPLAP